MGFQRDCVPMKGTVPVKGLNGRAPPQRRRRWRSGHSEAGRGRRRGESTWRYVTAHQLRRTLGDPLGGQPRPRGAPGPPPESVGVPGLDPDLLMTRMLLSQVQAWPVRGSSSGVSDLGERQDRILGLSSLELPQRREPHMRAEAGEDSHPGGGNNGVPSAAGEWVAEEGGVFSL